MADIYTPDVMAPVSPALTAIRSGGPRRPAGSVLPRSDKVRPIHPGTRIDVTASSERSME